MTDCKSEKIEYKRLKGREVLSNWLGGEITSDAGLLLLREVERRLGLLSSVAAALEDRRHPSYTKHTLLELLKQRVFGIALGYEDLNDHDDLRRDPALKVACEKRVEDTLASAPTLHRFEHSLNRADFIKIHKVMIEKFLASQDEPPDEIIIDFDATDVPLFGDQEKKFYHGYFRNYCYLPLYAFAGSSLLAAYLRPSDTDPSRHYGAILKLLVGAIRNKWGEVKIIVRGDCSFCRHRILDWCDRKGISYVVGLANNNILKDLASPYMAEAERLFAETGVKARLFGEFDYGAGTWKKNRRVIVKAERLEKGPNTRFVVTNITDRTPQEIYDGIYTQRGDMENRIKEQQLCLFADRTSCTEFKANQARLLLSALAYMLIDDIRKTGLTNTSLASARCDTVRLKLLKIGAVVIANTRKIVFRMPTAFPLKDIYTLTVARMRPSNAAATGFG